MQPVKWIPNRNEIGFAVITAGRDRAKLSSKKAVLECVGIPRVVNSDEYLPPLNP
jgi:hypothetical protein